MAPIQRTTRTTKCEFRLKPHVNGKIGEQATMFMDDPSGNSLEFKSFSDDDRLLLR